MKNILRLIKEEEKRQKETINLIPSENYPSKEVLKALGSILTSKYAEGYPGKRYYQGNQIVDEIEREAIGSLKELFGVPYANVQPYSGSPANIALLFALLSPGEKICGLKLSAGGHLTHGQPDITFSGRYFKSVQYDVGANLHFDYSKIFDLLKKEKPKLIFVGTTSYPFSIDFKSFAKMADNLNAYLVADISHIAGLVVGKMCQSPVPYAHIITSTTHKTLRGPRGAFILVTEKGLKKNDRLPELIDRAVFPGLQGGPHLNNIAAMAICFQEARRKSFKNYIRRVVENAQALAENLRELGVKVIGTENHLLLCDFSEIKGGYQMAYALEKVGIIVNKNSIPFDQSSPFYPSGIRVGTPAVTTRGMGKKEMKKIAKFIFEVYQRIKTWSLPEKKEDYSEFFKDFKESIGRDRFLKDLAKEIKKLALTFPLFRA